eukprot:gene12986-8834_t
MHTYRWVAAIYFLSELLRVGESNVLYPRWPNLHHPDMNRTATCIKHSQIKLRRYQEIVYKNQWWHGPQSVGHITATTTQHLFSQFPCTFHTTTYAVSAASQRSSVTKDKSKR